MFPLDLLEGVKPHMYATGDLLSEYASTQEDSLLESLLMKSSPLSHIDKKDRNGGLLDEKEVRRVLVGDIVLVAHGQVV